MKRPLVVAVLTAALLVHGRAPQQEMFPTGEDPNKLVEVIVQRGQGESPPVETAAAGEPDPPGSPILGKCLETGTRVCATCLVVSLFLGLLVGVGLARGNASGLSGASGGVGEALKTIWSHD
jgi:hypothetical protein